MKISFYFFLMLFFVQFTNSQDMVKAYSNPIIPESKIVFEDPTKTIPSFFENSQSLLSLDFHSIQLPVNSEALNSKLFSNITINEYQQIDYSTYFRGCNALENGISNTVDSRDLMLSITIDNFVNRILFPKGLLFRN